MSLPEALRTQLDELVRSSDVVLFMKGSRRFPQCGFSAQVVGILDGHGVKFRDVNVLSDPSLRDGIKAYSEWPTIPQLYVKGEFVGGCDIVKEMQQNGELGKLLGALPKPAPAAATAPAAPGKAPTLHLSKEAATAILAAAEPGSADVLRFEIGAGFRYDLSFGPRQAGDIEIQTNGVTLVMDPESAAAADGTSIGFVDGPGGGFKISNPREPVRVKQLGPEEVKAKLTRGDKLELFDVRTDAERAIAVIAGAKPFAPAALEALDKNTPIVFHCHHGGRSQAEAERAIAAGFRDVSNLKGGIDAWSQTVDPSVKRY